MTGQQIFIFGLLGGVFAFLVWGRIRYDLVAFAALIIGVAGGAIPAEHAFAGFGHEAVIIIALVLIASRALMNSGAVELIAQYVVDAGRSLSSHIGVMSVAGAALSAIINNVAALVILMTLDMETARKAGRSVSLSLMPLSFATILGGMVTMIGTPPNIVIAQYRDRALGEPFSMFDFSPVGLVCAIAGIAFVAGIGWRLIPQRIAPQKAGETESGLFVAEAGFPEGSEWVGQTPRDLVEKADELDVAILGLVRRGKRLPGFAMGEEIRKSDRLVVEGIPKSIEAFTGAAKLDITVKPKEEGLIGRSMTLTEAIVPLGARAVGRTALDMRLLARRGVTLIGVSRQGTRFRERVRNLTIQAGDVVLLLGPENRVADAVEWMGAMALADRSHAVIQRSKALLAIGIFAAAIAASVIGLISLPIALAAAVALYALFNIVNAREV
ncbi:MAG: SLC13 family permease, partial [Nitratireductor sp.]